jgi:hypothetical protein
MAMPGMGASCGAKLLAVLLGGFLRRPLGG